MFNTKAFASRVVMGILLALSSSSLFASGFQLFEGNGVNAANFSAGMAAGLFDASTASYNPAALVDIHELQVVGAGSIVNTSSKFTGSHYWASVLAPQLETPEFGTKNGGTNALVPAFHVAYPVNQRLVVAISATSPFGLSTDYESTIHPWMFMVVPPAGTSYRNRNDVRPVTRYSATFTELKVIDISPAFGYVVNDMVSVGGGLHVQYADVTFNSMVGAPATAGIAFDTESANNGDGFGWGYHLAVLLKPNDDLRLGLTYLSRVSHDLKGQSDLAGFFAGAANIAASGVNNPIIQNKNLRAKTVLPDSIIAGLFYRVNPKLDLTGTVVWTHWHLFKNITLRGVSAVSISPQAVVTKIPPITVSVPQNFRNTWRVMGGFNYHYSPIITLIGGLGFDQTPTNDTDRSVRLPDGNRFAIAGGVHYKHSDRLSFHVGWTHIFIKTVPIRSIQETGSQIVRMDGHSKNHADVIGAQMTYSLSKPHHGGKFGK